MKESALGEEVAGLADDPGVWVGDIIMGEGLLGLADMPGDEDMPGDMDMPGEVDMPGDMDMPGEVDMLAPGALAVAPACGKGFRP